MRLLIVGSLALGTMIATACSEDDEPLGCTIDANCSATQFCFVPDGSPDGTCVDGPQCEEGVTRMCALEDGSECVPTDADCLCVCPNIGEGEGEPELGPLTLLRISTPQGSDGARIDAVHLRQEDGTIVGLGDVVSRDGDGNGSPSAILGLKGDDAQCTLQAPRAFYRPRAGGHIIASWPEGVEALPGDRVEVVVMGELECSAAVGISGAPFTAAIADADMTRWIELGADSETAIFDVPTP